MSNLPEIDTPFLIDFLTKLLNTPSPTGNAEAAVAFTEETLKAFPELTLGRTRKGALLATWRGEQDEGPRAVTAHVDTLGAMVKEVKSNGRLKLTKIGGFALEHHRGRGLHGLHPFRAKGARLHPADKGLQPRVRRGGG